jgi:succinate-acetate transporter protein
MIPILPGKARLIPSGMFLISIFGVQVRGVATPNLLIGVLIFFGGICQFISGIMEFVSGNTVCKLWFSSGDFLTRAASLVQLCFPHTAPLTYRMP